MKDHLDARWQAILAHNNLRSFDDLWSLDIGWFEEPNHRRGGWSGVSRCELALPEGGSTAIFLKRQENHNTFSWRHPLQGVPTFVREFKTIRHYQAKGIPSLQPVYFATRQTPKYQRAILATEELAGFVSMENRVAQWLQSSIPARAERLRYLRAIADLLRTMHRHHIQHNCPFPKHLFTKPRTDGSIEVRIIDLEKSRWRPLTLFCTLRDLGALQRHAPGWSNTDRMWFFKHYLGVDHLTPYTKWLWQCINRKVMKKSPHLYANARPLRGSTIRQPRDSQSILS